MKIVPGYFHGTIGNEGAVKNEKNIVCLGEGMTPLLHLKNLGKDVNIPNLYLKDEGVIPTGTFKARGAAVGVSMARELGIKVLAMPTNGNAGAAWAVYCAPADIKAVIVMPKDAPPIPRGECVITGAALYLVNGLISDAGKIVARAVSDYGWFDASTLNEPYWIEGKKTMPFTKPVAVQLPSTIAKSSRPESCWPPVRVPSSARRARRRLAPPCIWPAAAGLNLRKKWSC